MNLQKIQALAFEEFGTELSLKCSRRHLVYQRAVYYTLCREFTNRSFAEIGATLGYDHSTVIYGLKLFDNLKLWKEKRYIDSYKRLKKLLTSLKNNYSSYMTVAQIYKTRYIEVCTENENLKYKIAQLSEELRIINS